MTRLIRYSSSIVSEAHALRSVYELDRDVPIVALEVDDDASRDDVLTVLASLTAALLEDQDVEGAR